MRWIFEAAAIAVAGMGLLTFEVLPGEAAVLSVGAADGSIGNLVCADVSGNSLEPQTPVFAQDCHAGPNQQFQWAGPRGRTIFAEAGHTCLTVLGGGTADGTPIVSSPCVLQALAQQFNYEDGQIINLKSGKCLDGGNLQNFTQLVINTCDGSPSQQWQIK